MNALPQTSTLKDRLDGSKPLETLEKARTFLNSENWQKAWQLAEQFQRHYESASSSAVSQNLRQEFLESFFIQCQAKYRLEQYAEALAHGLEGLSEQTTKDEPTVHIQLLNLVGALCVLLGNYSDGLDYLLQGLELAQPNSSEHLELLNTVGDAYFYLENYPEAIKTLEECLTLAEEQGNTYLTCSLHCKLCETRCSLKNFNLALEDGKKAIAIIDNFRGDKPRIASLLPVALCAMGETYREMGNFPLAFEHIEQAIHLLQDSAPASPKRMGDALLALGKTCLQNARLTEAQTHLEAGLTIYRQLGLKYEEITAIGLISELYEELHEFETALHYHKHYHILREEFQSERHVNRIQSLDMIYHINSAKREAEMNKIRMDELLTLNEQANRNQEQLNAITQQLLNAAHEKDEMLQMLAHNVRNPLATLRLIVDTALHFRDKIPAEKLNQRLATANIVIDRISNLMNGMLEVSRLESGFVEPKSQPMAVANNIRNVIAQFAPQSQEKSIQIVTHVPKTELWVVTDVELFNQVLSNLISNALKYSHLNSTVNIRIKQEEGWLKVSVDDEGQGILAEEREQVFRRFGKLSARPTHGEPSIGLGLYTVKRLTELLGGKVSVRSGGRDMGSTFTVQIPLNINEARDNSAKVENN
ncbi:MAG TPA: tetratricopeptide repeat-containing sensor histidine kinase [Anaerolineales bacterium]|nr:tetratricopeptide repeat-containing sensor histidine kinase [Anaerolineales bacterium]